MIIQQDQAETLARAVRAHTGLGFFDGEALATSLASIDVSGRVFSQRVGYRQPEHQDGAVSYDFSVRRLLSNGLAHNLYLNPGKRVVEFGAEVLHSMFSGSGMFASSDALVRRVRVDRQLMKLLSQSHAQGNPFSLICLCSTEGSRDGENEAGVEKTYSLVVPGQTDNPAIRRWEKDNMTAYER